MTTRGSNALEALEGAINSGMYASRMEAYLDQHFRQGEDYAHHLASEGLKVAERTINEEVKGAHTEVYANCIEATARGMLALAEARPALLFDVTEVPTWVHTVLDPQRQPRSKFILFNSTPAPCACPTTIEDEVFGLDGPSSLGLEAVILETGYYGDQQLAELTLVTPKWGTSKQPPHQGDIALTRFTSTGHRSGMAYCPLLTRGDGAGLHLPNTKEALRYLVGTSVPSHLKFRQSTGLIEETLGFPGAEEFLATHLPQLGNYFAALGERFTPAHA